MATVEVRANLAFRDWRMGELRQVDGDDPAVQGLVFGKYVTVVNVLPEPVAVAAEPVKRKARGKKEDDDVTDRDLPGSGDQSSTE